MGDIALAWGPADGDADLTIVDDDLGADDGLRTAVLLSLFTDRRAEEDDAIPSEDGERRGWWADQFAQVEGDLIGSRLWLLDRSTRREDLIPRAEEIAREALAWMLEDKVAESIDVTAEAEGNRLAFAITIHRPEADPASFRFWHVWAGGGL